MTPTYEQTKNQHRDTVTDLVAMESQLKMRERRDDHLQYLGKGRNATPSHSEE